MRTFFLSHSIKSIQSFRHYIFISKNVRFYPIVQYYLFKTLNPFSGETFKSEAYLGLPSQKGKTLFANSITWWKFSNDSRKRRIQRHDVRRKYNVKYTESERKLCWTNVCHRPIEETNHFIGWWQFIYYKLCLK